MADQPDKYNTINLPSTGIFKDKGSKFLAFAYPVKDENEVKIMVDTLRKEYFDARHHCFAYRIGADKLAFRANDDGEPSGTAGKPILGQILSNDLTNILIVVVRYFGGVLLGTGGLINAYKSASADAIANAVIVEKYVFNIYQIYFDYLQMNAVMKLVKDYDLDASNQIFEMSCSMKLRIKYGIVSNVLPKLESIEGLRFEYLCDE
ncbi:MAG: YigZ family protein [Bacteroidota bacterium]|nr:YigZ family protein [Bacteroidota bacterium]